MFGAELGLATVLQAQSLAQFITSRDRVSESVFLAPLLFAVMPRLRLASHLQATYKPSAHPVRPDLQHQLSPELHHAPAP